MAPSKGTVLAHQCVHLVFSFLSLFFVLSFVSPCVSAQQFFTNGISIIDAPSVGNPGHAPSNIPIAIEISGNGQLNAAEATNVNSSSSIHYTSLEIYLVSASTNSNFTVASGPELLAQEPGSTVKHLDYQIPDCIAPGDYNLTFYEGSMVNGESHFTITPVQIPIDNVNNPGGSCDPSARSDMNDFQGQPQASSPPSQPLFNAEGTGSGNGNGNGNGATNTRMTTSFTPILTFPTLVTITISASGGIPFPVFPTATVTVTPSPTPTTVVVVSLTTYTTTFTEQGQTSTETVTEPVWTSTAVVQNQNDSGFIPVNAARKSKSQMNILLAPMLLGLWIFI